MYERNLLTLFSAYDHNDQLKREKSFQYVEIKLHSSDSRYYLPDGTLYEQWISGYDSQGRIASTYGLNAEGKPLGDGKYTYEYDAEGRKSRVWSFNDLRRHIRRYTFRLRAAYPLHSNHTYLRFCPESHSRKSIARKECHRVGSTANRNCGA